MSLVEFKTEIPAAATEEVDNTLLELGVENWSLLEDAIARRAWIVGVFATEDEARAQWEILRGVLTVKPVDDGALRTMADADWKESYKVHFKAWRFGPLHWVPVWEREKFELPAGEKVLWLDPGMAFGTGNHETTRLCCERLVKLAEQTGAKGRVIDAGCGSGILALSAVLLGYRDVAAFDNDPVAVDVSRENAEMNGLGGKVHFYVGDLVSGLAGRQAELVLANIQADVLMRFTRELLGAIAPGGVLVLSGILERELEQVKTTFAAAAPGWAVAARVMGEWSDVMLTRP